MSVHTYEDCESVDLTEDEQSSEGNFSYENSPTHFVNCGSTVSSLSTIFSRPPPPLTPIKDIVCSQVARQTLIYKKVPTVIKTHETNIKSVLPHIETKNSIGKFMSVQVKPPSSTIPETQDLPEADRSDKVETVSVDSDDEQPDSTSSKQENRPPPYNTSIYSPKQPGKVIIIKKNNKLYKIVIPHNVMPSINQSSGPVLINIPEVGPLVITSDPRVTIPNPTVKPHTTQQLLNLDAIDQQQNEMQNSVKAQEARRAQEYKAKEAALCDKKFCWTFRRGRKRDLEGFTITDRLGFHHAEYQRSRKCSKVLDLIVTKKGTNLIKLMNNFNKLKVSMNKKKNVKLVKINEIVGKAPKTPKKSDQVKKHEPQEEENTITTDYDSDLLVTKKVVILGENDKEIEDEDERASPFVPAITRRRITKAEKGKKIQERVKQAWARGAYQNRKNRSGKNTKKLPAVRSCYVQMVRDKRVEKAYSKLCKSHIGKPSLGSSKSQISGPKRKEGTKIEGNGPDAKAHRTLHQKQLNQLRFFQNITNIFCSRVITSEADFKTEMNFLKPVLIVNEHNQGIINYSNEFSKNNIFYVVEESRKFPTSLLQNEGFISAVELGYVKLVDSQLFCKYLMGRIDVASSRFENCVSDHSYYKK